MIHFDTSDLDSARDGASPVTRIQVAEDAAPDQIVIPDAQLLVSAHFKKTGADLTLTGPDGKTVIVEGYFNLLTIGNVACGAEHLPGRTIWIA